MQSEEKKGKKSKKKKVKKDYVNYGIPLREKINAYESLRRKRGTKFI